MITEIEEVKVKNWWIGRRWLVLCSLVLLGVLVVFSLMNEILPASSDVVIYFKYAQRTLEGGEIPFRDFVVEYPPFALFFMYVPALVCYLGGGLDLLRYTWLFHVECFLLTMGTLWLGYSLLVQLYPKEAARKFKLQGQQLVNFTMGAFLIAIYLYQRLDVGAAFLTMLALWWLYKGRLGWSGVALALGTMAKLYPAAMLVPILLYLWTTSPLTPLLEERGTKEKFFSGKRAAIGWYVIGFGVGCAVTVLPFAVIGLKGLWGFLQYHSERGVEVEAVFASIIALANYLGVTGAKVDHLHNSFEMVSDWGKPLATFSTALTVMGLLVIYGWLWRNWRQRQERLDFEWLVTASSLCVLWFILANKVLSPQYMVWLLPMVIFWKGWNKVAIFLVAVTLSNLPYPFLVDWLVRLDPLPFAIVAVRNVLLIVVFGLLVRDLWPRPNKELVKP